MYRYKLDRLRLNDGTEIEPGKLTVIVGPNNSGKSRLLRDVKDLCTSPRANPIVITEVSHTRPRTVAELMEAYAIQPQLDVPNARVMLMTLGADMNTPHQAALYVGATAEWRESFQSTVQNILDNWEGMKATFTEYFGNYFVTRLTTESRLLITKESSSGNQRGQIDSLLPAFYREGKTAEEKLSGLVSDAFDQLRVNLDYSGLSYLSVKLVKALRGSQTIRGKPVPSWNNTTNWMIRAPNFFASLRPWRP